MKSTPEINISANRVETPLNCDIYVILGLSAAGKSYLCDSIAQKYAGIQAIAADGLFREMRHIYNVSEFSNADQDMWTKLDKYGNTKLCRYWLFRALLLSSKAETLLIAGYNFYFEENRSLLEKAAEQTFSKYRVVYVHLLPNLKQLNLNRAARGMPEITRTKMHKQIPVSDLSFVTHTIDGVQAFETCILPTKKLAEQVIPTVRLERPDDIRATTQTNNISPSRLWKRLTRLKRKFKLQQ